LGPFYPGRRWVREKEFISSDTDPVGGGINATTPSRDVVTVRKRTRRFFTKREKEKKRRGGVKIEIGGD